MDPLILAASLFCLTAFAAHFASIICVIARQHSPLARAAAEDAPLADAPSVSVIRPVCGLENFIEETIESTFTLDYPDFEIIFCVAHPADPIVPMLHELMARYPRIRARLLIGNEAINNNPKLNNAAKGWRAARHDWIVIADSNVLMSRDYLHALMARWEPGTGLVCAPPVGAYPDGLWAELECAFLNTYQLRWQCFADSLGMGFAQGKSMLWRRDVLENAGGIPALATELAEDAAATKLVRRAGLRVRLSKTLFEQPLGGRKAREVWGRQLRWARLRRDSFKLHFGLEILSGGIPPLVAAGFIAHWAALSVPASVIALAAVWYGGEALLARAADWHCTRRSPLLWMLRDLMLPALWVAAWFGDDFVWRGNVMRVAGRARSA